MNRFLIWSVLLTVADGVIAAQKTDESLQPGDVVLVRKESAELRIKDKTISHLERGELLRVSMVNKSWLLIWDKQGWVHRDDVWIPSAAAAHFTQEINQKPTAIAHHFRGVAYRAQRRYQQAIADFDAALRLEPNNAAVYNNRGSAWHKQGQVDRAIADFSKAIALSAKTMLFWVNRSAAWADKGDAAKALSDAQQAVRLAPNDATAVNSRGVSWFEAGEFQKALADYDQAIKLAPHFAVAYANRAAVLKRQGRYDQARRDFESALRIDPKSATTNNDYAWFLTTCPDKKYRNTKKAVRLAKEACRLTANHDWNMLDTLAVAYAESGQPHQAIRVLESALKVAPADKRGAVQKKLQLYSKLSARKN